MHLHIKIEIFIGLISFMFLNISLDTLYSSYVSVCPFLVTGIHIVTLMN